MPAPVAPGDHIELRLDSLAVGGEAVGRYEGFTIFVLFGCPGDVAEVEVTEVSRSFGRGRVVRVVEPSPDCIEPPCPHFGDCGGCQLQHISYPAQLRHKTAMIRDSLSRIGDVTDLEVPDTWGMDEPWLYRNRAEYKVDVSSSGEFALGFARYHSHDVVPLTECRLQHPLSEGVRTAAVDLVNQMGQSPSERASVLGLETLASFRDGRGLATLVCESRPPFLESLAQAVSERVPDLAGVLWARRRGRSPHRSPSEAILGASHVIEDLGGETYRVSADSFFQTNPVQAARALELAKEWAAVQEDDVVMDLYSGVGTFLLPLARTARRSFGIEESASAARDAHANLRHWRLTGVRLYERRVERLLPKWVEQQRRADIIVLDPPRKGCGPIVLAHVAKLRPKRVILISCHPATLARDLKTLAELGYRPTRLQPVDMFPQTWHVEIVVLCERLA